MLPSRELKIRWLQPGRFLPRRSGGKEPNNEPEIWESMEDLGGYKNKNLRNLYDYEGLMPFELAIVEPQRIELWSREDNSVPSTCLVDSCCREKQGYQHPKLLLSYLS